MIVGIMDIKKLDSDVISKIRSSFTISSVGQCVFELVCNSLDAKSTAIAVRVNLKTFKIQVADNGEGITKENMALLGIRYATNKYQGIKDLARNLKTYGFRGEAIASIVEMSKCVSITSRSKLSSETYDKTLSKNFNNEAALTKHRPSIGTTVTVLGWLNTVPVRRKRIVPEIELEDVKKQLERLIIINPGTSFTLRNDMTGLLLLNSPRHVDILSCFRHLHPEINDSFTLLKVSKKKLSIQMLIHKELFLSSKYQYVYVNKRPVRSTKIVNRVYRRFCRKNVNTKNNMLQTTKRYPVYVMNIKCPQSCVDNLMGPPKTEIEFTCWDLVLACIDKLLRTLLGSEENKKEISAQKTCQEKFSFGVSQLNRVVQASAFKRKSSSADDNNSESVSSSKQKRLEDEDLLPNPKKKGRVKQANGWLDKQVLKNSQSTGNYQIEDSGKQQRTEKPAKIKSIIKKPLAIKVKRKGFERESKMDVDIVHSNKKLNEKEEREFYNRNLTKQNHIFDQRSVYSRLNTDEDQGKDLIMDMFLKSTQVYKNENDEIEETRADNTKETIEESNIFFENNVQDTILGINTTMSISVNVKKRRLKNANRRTSEFVPTTQKSGLNDFLNQNVYSSAFSDFQGDCNSQLNVDDAEIIKDTSLPLRRNILDPAEPPVPIAKEILERRISINADHRINELNSAKHDHLMIRQINPTFVSTKSLHKRDACSLKPVNFNNKQPVSMVDLNKKQDLTSKYTQTSQNNVWRRQKSYQTDLANRFDEFTLEHKNLENVPANYTILINTVRKQREYKFVRKSEDMEVDEDPNGESNEFKPLKICNCDKEGKMFRFRKEPSNEEHVNFAEDRTEFKPLILHNCDEEDGKTVRFPEEPNNKRANFEELRDYQKTASQTFGESVKERKENPSGYHRNEEFIMPQNPVVKFKTIIKKKTSVNNDYISTMTDKGELKKNHLLFRGMTKHRPPKAPIKSTLYYESPYFSEKGNENIMKGATYGTFQPMFQSTQIPSNNPKVNFSREFAFVKNPTYPSRPDHVNYSKTIQPEVRDCNIYEDNGCCLKSNCKCGCKSYYYSNRNRAHCSEQFQTNDGRENEKPDIACHLHFNPEVFNNGKQQQEIIENRAYSRKAEKSKIENLKCDCHKKNIEYLLQREGQNNLQLHHGEIPYNRQGNICCQHQNFNIYERQRNAFCLNQYGRPGAQQNPPPLFQDQHKQLPLFKNQVHHGNDLHETQYGEQNQANLFRNSPLEVYKDEQNGQDFDSTGPSWFAPVVSDEHFYFEPTPKNSSGSLGAQLGMDDGKVLSPKFSNYCSPNIFSNEMLGAAENNTQSVAPAGDIKLNQGGPGVVDLNTLCDLADLGLVNLENAPVPETDSNLEVTLPSERERQNIIEKELLEIQNNDVNHFFATESEQKDLDTNNKEGADERSRIIVDSQNEWMRQFNENGLRFFVNKRTEYRGVKAPYKGKLTVFLPNHDLTLLKKHSMYIDSLGLGVQFFTNGLYVTDVPLCIKDKFSAGADLEDLNKILNMLIKDIIDFLKHTGGSGTLMPKIIQNIINLKACRGAIKFGDFLSRQECTRLLNDLSKCTLPFQCAHGRPTLTPLLSLNEVPSEIEMKKIDLQKLYRTKTS